MLNKEECEKALDTIARYCSYYKSSLFPPIFELSDELICFKQLIKEHFEPQPYKWEDLKVGMWVLDRKPFCEEFTFIKITKILSKSDCEYLYHDKNKKVFFDNMECHAREWEDNRFFPVWMANMKGEVEL